MLEDLETKEHEYESKGDQLSSLMRPPRVTEDFEFSLFTTQLQESARNTTESQERLGDWNIANLKTIYNKVSGFVKQIKSLQKLQTLDQAQFVTKSQELVKLVSQEEIPLPKEPPQ